MPFLNDWKEAKRTFERTAGRGAKKPTEKLWGIFRKPSGLEDAFKGMDSALAKKEPSLAARALAKVTTAKDAYIRVMNQGWRSVDGGDPLDQLERTLKGLEAECRTAVAALDTDPNAVLTLAEAIGAKSLKAFQDMGAQPGELYHNFKAWQKEPTAAGVEDEGRWRAVPDVQKEWNAAKKLWAEFVKIYGMFDGMLATKMKRQQALDLAQKYHAKVGTLFAQQAGIPHHIYLWIDANRNYFKGLKRPGEITKWGAAKAAAEWELNGPSFRHLEDHQSWWNAMLQMNARFLDKLPR